MTLRRTTGMAFAILAALILMSGVAAIPALGQSTTPATEAATAAPDAAGPLRIHITAVQGAGQYRPEGTTHWLAAKAELDLPEGVELRTGAHGTIQFTIGTDQVFRVDRLTVVKVLRANLQADGTIRTDVGMTYGRVSKDVDLPAHPHQDTIITPSSTLAVRGTEVGVFDSPPYMPEATSLTGHAIFTDHIKGLGRPFGAKGEGKSKIAGDNANAAQSQLSSQYIGSQGAFDGSSPAQQAIVASLGGNASQLPGVFGPNPYTGLGAGMAQSASTTSIIGSLNPSGEILLQFIWASQTVPSTDVTYTVTSPLGEVVSSSTPTVTAPSGGSYGAGSNHIALSSPTSTTFGYTGYQGFQYVIWGDYTNPKATYPTGNYKVVATLNSGTIMNPVTIDTQFFASQINPGGNSGFSATTVAGTLSTSNPTETYTVKVPISNAQVISHVP